MDEFPASEGHCLIITKEHFQHLTDIDDKTYLDLMSLLKTTIKDLQALYKDIQYNVVYCEGENAGQGINHVHWHIVLRHQDDGMNISLNEHLDKDVYEKYKKAFKLKLENI